MHPSCTWNEMLISVLLLDDSTWTGNMIKARGYIVHECPCTRGIQKLMQLGDFHGISYCMSLKIDGTPWCYLRPLHIWKQYVFWTLNHWHTHVQSTRGHYHWPMCVEKMTIHQSVEIRAVIRNHYSLLMNSNAINHTWVFVNENT